jgi:hypothetical protein
MQSLRRECQSLFDPKRVLLRRTFFINKDYSKYISVGFYPARDYQLLVENGAHKKRPLLVPQHHLRTFAEHLPRLCDAVCREEHYFCVGGAFKLFTAGSYRTAKISLDKQLLYLNLGELRYLSHMIHVVHNQQLLYLHAQPDVMTCAAAALANTEYVEPSTSANKAIIYPQLY